MKKRVTVIDLLILLFYMGVAWMGTSCIGAAEEEGVYRVNLLVLTAGGVTPGEEVTVQVETFLDKYKPPAPGEPPKPLSPGDWVFIGGVPLRFEVRDEDGGLVGLNMSQALRTDDNGSMETTFKAPEKEGDYTMTVYALMESNECSDWDRFTVSTEEQPLPTPIPGIQLELLNLKVWTNGTVSLDVRLHEYESQTLEEVQVNERRFSWSDGSTENATIRRGETRRWRRDVGSFNEGEAVRVVVGATNESGSADAVAEVPPTPPVPTITDYLSYLVAGAAIASAIGWLLRRSRV